MIENGKLLVYIMLGKFTDVWSIRQFRSEENLFNLK